MEKYAGEDFWVGTCPNGGCNVDHYDLVEDKIQSVFDACSGLISENPGIAQCTDRYRRFVRTWLAQHDDESYGFTVKNPVYFAEQELRIEAARYDEAARSHSRGFATA